jgi:Kef-type K+ transport system membrane component KefB
MIIVGAIYGAPLAAWLPVEWQASFTALGYLGLILLVLEGALSTDLGLLTHNFVLSFLCAITGVVLPFAFSFLLLVVAFRFTILQAFVAGASLCATSLGTTIVVLQGVHSGKGDAFRSNVASVLVTAAVLDDIVGLIMASIIPNLGHQQHSSLGWTIGRPIVAFLGLAVILFVVARLLKWVLWARIPDLARFELTPNRTSFFALVFTVFGVVAAGAYAGTSPLVGAFAAGLFLAYLGGMSAPEGISDHDGSPTPYFLTIFQKFLGQIQNRLLVPLFFASIGFSIPLRNLWDPHTVWRGITYASLMLVGKLAVGLWIPVWSFFRRKYFGSNSSRTATNTPIASSEKPRKGILHSGLMLGSGMIARGEIGLLICQIGFNGGEGPLPYELFTICLWAIVVNTLIGPILVSLILWKWEGLIMDGEWGTQTLSIPRTASPADEQ